MATALAVFTLGGAAVGKTATIRQRYIGTGESGSAEYSMRRPGFHPRRHFDPDQYKTEIGPMYSDAADAQGLHGPSGPLDMAGFRAYPPHEQAIAREYICSLGFSSVEEFGQLAILPPKEHFFGGGLTHEASSFIASANLDGQIAAGPHAGSFVWDAVGNAGRYKLWINRSLAEEFDIEVLYVSCPIPVALRRAATRPRRVTADIVRGTHAKATAAARDLLSWIDEHPLAVKIRFSAIQTSDSAELEQALVEGYGE